MMDWNSLMKKISGIRLILIEYRLSLYHLIVSPAAAVELGD